MFLLTKRHPLLGILILLLASFPGPLPGGVTGTVAGHVTSSQTGEPMPGVNVAVTDTYLGAVTDAEGWYLITNLPPRSYQLRISLMGYRTVIQQEVLVLPDLRTTINVQLEPTVIELEEVVVTAPAPMIRRDITATTHFISSDEIRHIPVKSFIEIVELQPGVAAGHIRGGRKTEVLYMVDGLPIEEAIEGIVGSDIPSSAIAEMSIQTGGFSAEYGNVMSGVVNIITKAPAATFSGLLEWDYLDPQSNPAPFSNRRIGDHFLEMNFTGPLGRNLKFFMAGNLIAPNSRWRDELFGNRHIVLNSEESYSYNFIGKLTFHPIEQLKISSQGLLSLWSWREYDHKWKYNLEGLPSRSKQSYRLSLTAIHTLSPRTFYELRLSRYDVLKSINGQSFQDAPNLTFEDYNGDGKSTPADWRGFVIAGVLPWWLDHQEVHNILKFDFISQINANHQLKAGLMYEGFDLYKKNVQIKYIRSYDPKFPFYITYDTEYDYRPWRGALFIQDKIELEGLVANLGLRYDYFDPTAQRPALEEQIFGDRSEWILDSTAMVPASPKSQFSPRLGLAIPVGPTDVLQVSYGYFFQLPAFDYLYTNSNLNTATGFSPLGDPDLKPARTVMWEVSYKGQLNESTIFDATIFNKDISNRVDANTYKNQRPEDIFRSSGYTRFVNLALANIRGFELYLKRSYSQRVSGKISYTFMVAKGTGSSEFEKFDWTERGYQVPVDQYYLSWDQRHTVVVNMDFRSRHNGWLNLLWRWNSPLPYTKNMGPTTEPNNTRMAPTTTLDLRLNQDISLGRGTGFVYFEMLNAGDRENVLWLDDLGLPGGVLGDPGAIDLRRRFRFGLGLKF